MKYPEFAEGLCYFYVNTPEPSVTFLQREGFIVEMYSIPFYTQTIYGTMINLLHTDPSPLPSGVTLDSGPWYYVSNSIEQVGDRILNGTYVINGETLSRAVGFSDRPPIATLRDGLDGSNQDC